MFSMILFRRSIILNTKHRLATNNREYLKQTIALAAYHFHYSINLREQFIVHRNFQSSSLKSFIIAESVLKLQSRQLWGFLCFDCKLGINSLHAINWRVSHDWVYDYYSLYKYWNGCRWSRIATDKNVNVIRTHCTNAGMDVEDRG